MFSSEFHLVCKDSDTFDGPPLVTDLALDCQALNPSRYARSCITPYSISCTRLEVDPQKMLDKKGIHVDARLHPRYPTTDSSECGWYFTFWTPIPISLFTKAETRTFRFTVRVGLGPGAAGGILSAERTLSISHLQYRSMV